MAVDDHMDYFMALFPQLTNDECDSIAEILDWDGEKKAAFFFAKRIFDEENDDEITEIDDE